MPRLESKFVATLTILSLTPIIINLPELLEALAARHEYQRPNKETHIDSDCHAYNRPTQHPARIQVVPDVGESRRGWLIDHILASMHVGSCEPGRTLAKREPLHKLPPGLPPASIYIVF